MAVTGKKINELDSATNLTNETVLPVVVVSGGVPDPTAKKITIDQILSRAITGVSSVNSKTGNVILTGQDINVSTSDSTPINSSLENKQNKYTIVTNADSTNLTISPNTIYDFSNTTISTLNITNYSQSYNESVIYFTSGSSGTTITLPNTLSWVNGNELDTDTNTKYVISICNGAVVAGSF